MIDSVLFVLKDITDETVLAVLGALQAYETAAIEKIKGWNSTHKDNRKIDLQMHIVCDVQFNFIFERCLTSVKGIYATLGDAPRIKYDYISAINSAQIRLLGQSNNKPFATATGIILGCEAKVLPDVSNLYPKIEIEPKILATEDIIATQVCYDLCFANNVLPIAITININIKYYSLEQRGRLVALSRAVLGTSSFETYLACCMNKPVFEIQLSKDLFKWSHKKYICATVDDKEIVSKGIKQCLQLALGK